MNSFVYVFTANQLNLDTSKNILWKVKVNNILITLYLYDFQKKRFFMDSNTNYQFI